MDKYSYTRDGKEIKPPNGWRILSEGKVVPQYHREFSEIYNSNKDKFTNKNNLPINYNVLFHKFNSTCSQSDNKFK